MCRPAIIGGTWKPYLLLPPAGRRLRPPLPPARELVPLTLYRFLNQWLRLTSTQDQNPVLKPLCCIFPGCQPRRHRWPPRRAPIPPGPSVPRISAVESEPLPPSTILFTAQLRIGEGGADIRPLSRADIPRRSAVLSMSGGLAPCNRLPAVPYLRRHACGRRIQS